MQTSFLALSLSCVLALGAQGCDAEVSQSTPGAVTLINAFELSEAQRNTFPAAWDAVAEFMRAQPGFIDAKLHELVGPPEARFHYVNVAHWESAEAFEDAMSREEFQLLVRDFQADGDYPGLYRVARDVGAP